jgi:hypothetical protein
LRRCSENSNIAIAISCCSVKREGLVEPLL